jgi:starch synthase (maltosyl-transferring)
VKRAVGEEVLVEADVFTDGHDAVVAELLWRFEGADAWETAPMKFLGNDHWQAAFPVERLGCYEYTGRGWTDPFVTWQRDLKTRKDAGQDLSVDFLIGAGLADVPELKDASLDPEVRYRAAIAATPPLPDAARVLQYERVLKVRVDPLRARFSTWYELFPRSARDDGKHGSFKDVIELLPQIEAMGFDVLYLPPIHPVGVTERKGKNNALKAEPGDVGSPWAIGAKDGGHTAVHPELGTVDDVRDLVEACRGHGIELALDLAFQCAPDHPWVKEHPDWFRHRPDGSIRHAENPPKLYQDIVPLDFESEDWPGLWDALLEVVRSWIGQGVHVFRVDNPHTKPFAFWDWLIGEVKRDSPEVIFLSEAFTRPRVMERLAKGGFTQSYTYFAWRSAKWELTEYLTELTQTELAEYMRPNFWPNTPDILTEQLQTGGRPVFAARLLLAATLGASYGIYGPAFELMEGRNLRPGSEEYLDSEKYQLREWKPVPEGTLEPLITAVNAARSDHPALRRNDGLRFHHVDNDMLIAYSKHDPASRDTVLMVVNLDPNHMQAGWVGLDLGALDIDPAQPFQAHDVLDGSTYLWSGSHNYVELRPDQSPGHILHLRRHLRTERDFEYFG